MPISRYVRPDGNDATASSPVESTKVLPNVLRAIGEYPVETDAEHVRRFRENLAQIGARLATFSNETPVVDLEGVEKDVRGVLREYRDHAVGFISRLRGELTTVAEALTTLLSTVQNSSGSELRLTDELGKLRSLAASSDLSQIRAGLLRSTTLLAEYADQMRRERDGVIAQLKSEIRSLHERLEDAQYAAKLDAGSGTCRRNEFLRLLRRKVVGGEPVGIASIRISNFGKLCEIPHPTAASEVMGAFLLRVKNVLPASAIIGSWDQGRYFVLSGSEGLQVLARRLRAACIGRYVYIHQGASQTFDLCGSVGHLVPFAGEDGDSFVSRLDCEVSEADALSPTGTAADIRS